MPFPVLNGRAPDGGHIEHRMTSECRPRKARSAESADWSTRQSNDDTSLMNRREAFRTSAKQREIEAQFEDGTDPLNAAARFPVHDVIEPNETR